MKSTVQIPVDAARFALVCVLTACIVLPARAAQGTTPYIDIERSQVYEKAIREMSDGEFDVAVIHLKTLLQEHPEHIPSRILLGRAYLRQGRAREAENELRNALARGADETLVLVPLGNALLMQGRYEEILRDIHGSRPGSDGGYEVLTLRGRAKYELNRLSDAERDFDRAINLGPGQVNPLLGRALIATARGEWDAAAALIGRALDLDPANAEAWYQRAELLRATEDYGGAMVAYGRALEHQKTHMRARLGRASLALYLDNPNLARDDARIAGEQTDRDVTAPFILWQALLRLGQKEAAGEAFTTAVELTASLSDDALSKQASLQRIAGLIALAKADYERAGTYLARVVAKNPHDHGILKLLAEIQLRLGNFKDAESILLALAKKFPADAEISSLLGEAYMRQGHYVEAASALQRAVAMTSNNENVRTRLALSRIGTGETDTAIADLKQIIELESTPTSAAILLTTLQLKRKDVAGALATVSKLEAKQPYNPVVLNLKGAVFLAIPDRDRAWEAFSMAVDAAQNFVPALFNLAQMSLDAGAIDEAEKRFDAIFEIDPRSTAAITGMAEVATARGDKTAAVSALEKAIAIDSSNRRTFARLIQLHLELGKLNDAERVAEMLAERHYDTLEAHEMMGRTKVARGKPDEAMLLFRRAKLAAGSSGEDLLRIAREQVDIEDFKGARVTLIQAINSGRSNDAVAALVRLDVLLGDFEAAMARAIAQRDEQPSEALGYVLVAEVSVAQGKYAEAIDAYRSSLAIAPNAERSLGLANALFLSGAPEAGLETLRAWFEQHPQDLHVEREYALRLITMQRISEAQPLLERLSKLVPNDPLTLTTLARCYQLARDPRARVVAEQAYSIRPDWSASADTLGWILVTEGDLKGGLTLLRTALSRDNNPLIRFHIASTLAELGREAEARKELEIIRAQHGDLPWIADVNAFEQRIAQAIK